MKKLRMPQRGYHAFLLFLLSMFISSFSFGQTITGILSDDNNKPLVGPTVCHVAAQEELVFITDYCHLINPER